MALEGQECWAAFSAIKSRPIQLQGRALDSGLYIYGGLSLATVFFLLPELVVESWLPRAAWIRTGVYATDESHGLWLNPSAAAAARVLTFLATPCRRVHQGVK